MKPSLNILKGELERLFSAGALKSLCEKYLDIDVNQLALYNENKAVFVRQLVDWCDDQNLALALADIVQVEKKGMVDPRLKHVYAGTSAGTFNRSEIPGYRVKDRVVGDDAYGLYECEDEAAGGNCLLLLVNGPHAVDDSAARRFIMEYRLLASSGIDFLPEVLASGVLSDRRPWMVIRTPGGRRLTELAPFGFSEALVVFGSLVDMLERLDSAGFLHGDLRPDHFWLADGESTQAGMTVLGIGFDKFQEASGWTRCPVMTQYMAPEVLRGDEPTLASEMYSLGCCLFFLLSGKSAFTGRRAVDVAAGHIRGQAVTLEEAVDGSVPRRLKALVTGLLSRDVTARTRDFATLRRLMEEARQDIEDAAVRAAQTGTRDDVEDQLASLFADPTSEACLADLLDAAEVYNAWGAILPLLEQLASSVADPAAAWRLTLAAADMAANKVRDYDRAIALYEQLAAADPSDMAVFDARVALYRKQRNFDAVLQMLGARAEMTQDPVARAEVLLQIAGVLEGEAGEFSKAFDYYAACLTGTDRDEAIIRSMETLAQKSGRMAELAQIAANAAVVAEQNGNAALCRFLYGKLGRWYEAMNQAAYALQCYQKLVALDPSDVDALEAMAVIYRSAQQWIELSQVLAQRAEAESLPETRRDLQCEVAQIYWERLSEVNESKRILTGILADDPGCARAATLLTRILEKIGDYANLVEILGRAVTSMEKGPDRVSEHFRLAEIYEVRLQDVKNAAVHYRAALDIDGGHLDSLKGLERIYAMTDNFAGLREVLESQLAIAVTAKQKIALLERLAKMYEEEFKDVDLAIDAYRSIVKLDDENSGALLALTRHLRKQKLFDELVEVLKRRADLTDREEERRELLSERAQIFKEELKDAELATKAINELAALGGSGSALAQIVRSQIELGEFAAAEATYRKMLDEEKDAEQKVGLLIELAAFQSEKLHNLAASETTLNEARDMAPQNEDVLSELADLMVLKGDYAGAVELLKQKVELVEGSKKRSAVYGRIGTIALESIKDEDMALEYLERAVEADHSNLQASDRLSRIYRKRSRFEDAIAIYERWVPSAAALSRDAQLDLFTHAGEAYVKVDRKEKALELFKKAAELASEPSLMKRLGDLALEMEEWELAQEQLVKYVKECPDMDNDEKVEISVKRGRAAFGAGHLDEAAKMARQATVMAPDDVEARILLADVHEARKDYRGAVEARLKVLESLSAKDERWFDIMKNTATLMFEKLRNAEGAAALLKNALQSDPGNRDLLGELMKMYTAAKDFKSLVGVLQQIAALDDEPVKLSKYYLGIAKIYRRELKQLDNAVEYFNKALEKDPGLKDAEKALLEVLQEQKNWEGLEKAYKTMIAGFNKDTTVEDKLAVFQPLADLYMTKLDREADAIVLLETMARMQPDNPAWNEQLTEVYGWNTRHAEKAIALHHRLLRANITRVESFRMLYRIFSALEDPDRAWCVASLLSLLNQASPDERQYYRDYLPEGYPPISDSIGEDNWLKQLYHEDMNIDITNIFTVIIRGIVAAKCQPLQAVGMDVRAAVDPRTDPAEFSKLVNFGLGVTAATPMPLFYQTHQQGFGIVETNPPVMIAGGDAAEMKDYLGLAFRLGQELTLMRPGLFAKKVLKSGTELSAWLLAAVKIFAPQLPVPGNLMGPVTEKLQPIRAAMQPGDNEKLQGYVQSFLSHGANVDLKRWARAIDYTGDRVGLILCGDIAIGRRIIDGQAQDEKERAERIRELSLFVVSDDYFALRKKLGVALQAG